MKESSFDAELSPQETERRRDAALLRALSTPHKKQADMKIGKGKKGVADKSDAKPVPSKHS